MKIVAISDQHGHLPAIPECDLLIVAGDQCIDQIGGLDARRFPNAQWDWFLHTWLPWREAQPVEQCVVTWGNHDYCGEQHENVSLPPSRTGKTTIIASDTQVATCGVKLYLTPWSNTFMKWAFMRAPDVLARYYEQIPTGLDILVSHQPPLGYGGTCKYYNPGKRMEVVEEIGSAELYNAILDKRPRAVICGHVHSGFGRCNLPVPPICDCHPWEGVHTVTCASRRGAAIPVYNVSVVDEGYALKNPPTVIEL